MACFIFTNSFRYRYDSYLHYPNNKQGVLTMANARQIEGVSCSGMPKA